jgi:hypothetical protein
MYGSMAGIFLKEAGRRKRGREGEKGRVGEWEKGE